MAVAVSSVNEQGCPHVAGPFPAKLVAGAMIPSWQRAELMGTTQQTGNAGMLLLYLLQDQRTRSLDQAAALIAEWHVEPRDTLIARRFGER